MANIIWKRPDNTIAITWPMIEGVDLEKHAEELLKRGDVPDDHEMVAIGADLPERDEFRGAMVWDGKRVAHDMALARELRRNQIRRARMPLFAILDIAYQRADERGDTKAKATVAAQKQVLRDAPADPRIDKAATPDDLRAVKLPNGAAE